LTLFYLGLTIWQHWRANLCCCMVICIIEAVLSDNWHRIPHGIDSSRC